MQDEQKQVGFMDFGDHNTGIQILYQYCKVFQNFCIVMDVYLCKITQEVNMIGLHVIDSQSHQEVATSCGTVHC